MISINSLITLLILVCITIDSIESNKQLDTSPMKKYRADIETVKQNIDEYNKLMKIDTKKLSDQQKEMIQRIVERVARLKESIETNVTTKSPIEMNNNNQTLNVTANTKQDDALLLGTTTMMPLALNTLQDTITMDTSTSNYDEQTDGTTFQLSESYEGRSNTIQQPNSRSTTMSGTSIKMKNHRTSTKKPSTTKSSTKRITMNTGSTFHPIKSSTKPYISTIGTTIINNDQTVMTPTTLITTLQPQQQQKINEQTTTSSEEESKTIEYSSPSTSSEQDDVQINENNSDDSYSSVGQPQQSNQNVIIQQRTPVGTGSGYLSADILNQRPSVSTGTNYLSSALYDTNVTTSTIIDSLSNHAREDYYNTNLNKGANVDINKDKKPTGGTAKPTKYHYYPHNQHIYLLPECAIQQVCNAVYVRLNYTQPLCACPSRYRDPCSASLNEDDQHTTKLIGDAKKKAITLAKTCEATTEMRECRSPKDWSLLALQNTRTGKSHYLVICRCPDHFKLEGPMAHDQPTYASVPGIRVFGMMCVKPGFAIRKPSVQPPKRYQLQKPYYIPQTSNKYGLNKDNIRPSISSNGYQQQQQSQQLHDSYQLQHQANYQYLNRPENSPIISSSSNTDYPDPATFSNNNGIYGRNNEKKTNNDDEQNSELTDDISKSKIDNIRVKRFATIKDNNKNDKYNYDNDDRTPEFPWDKVVEFQKTLVWDN